MAFMNLYVASCAARMRSAARLVRLACSTSLRKATDAPPGWLLSHSQWRGNKVTSRATTPSRGRPGPAGVAGAGGVASTTGSSSLVEAAIRSITSAILPRQSISISSLVCALKTRMRDYGCASDVFFTARATSASGPDAMQRTPSKAMQLVWLVSMFFSINEVMEKLYPGKNRTVNNIRV